jgi:hypothetical protein
MGALARRCGDSRRAFELVREALALLQRDGAYGAIAAPLQTLGALLGDAGRYEVAVRLLGAVESAREAAGAVLEPAEAARQEAALNAARRALGEESFVAGWQQGRSMSPDVAAAYAMDLAW